MNSNKRLLPKVYNCFMLIVIVCILITTSSCASKEPMAPTHSVNGIEYISLVDIDFNGHNYEIYEPKNLALMSDESTAKQQSLQYVYQELNKPDVDEWRINYFYKYLCLTDNLNLDEKFIDLLIQNVDKVLQQYEKRLNISFDYYDLESEVHNEFIIKHMDADSIYLVVMYVPFYIIDNTQYQTYNVLVPVKTFFAYRYNGNIVFDYNEIQTTVVYSNFKSLSNVSNIVERGNKYV